MKLKYYIASANNYLDSYKEKIELAVAKAEEFAVPLLRIDKEIDIIFSSVESSIIPEDGIGGRALQSNFILMSIDPNKDVSIDIIYQLICHELAHAERWNKNSEFTNCIFDEVILEGLATVFQEKSVENIPDKQLFLQEMINRPDEENEKIYSILKPILYKNYDSVIYNHSEVFYNGNEELPRWSGYSLGFYIVKKYMEETGLGIEDIFDEKFEKFKNVRF